MRCQNAKLFLRRPLVLPSINTMMYVASGYGVEGAKRRRSHTLAY